MIKIKSFDNTKEITSNILEIDQSENININYIPRGNGLSPRLISAVHNGTSIILKQNNNFDFNIVDLTVKVNSNATFAEVNKEAFKYGLELPVIGYSSIQIGAGIAGCIHGKNHFMYDFGDQVDSIEIKLFTNEILNCSNTLNKEIFDLTIGGYGSTGIILSAIIKLKRIQSTTIKRIRSAIEHPYEFLEHFNDENIDNYNSIFGWHNLHPIKKQFASGFIYKDQYLGEDNIMPSLYPVKPAHKYQPNSIYILGQIIFGSFFNKLYEIKENKSPNISIFNIYSEAIASKNIYWSIMRRNGFIETQFIVPTNNFYNYTEKIKFLLKKHNAITSVCITKPCKGERKFLRFRGNGINIDITGVLNKNNYNFFSELNKIAIEFDAIPNILKCSILSKDNIVSSYNTEYEYFMNLYIKTFGRYPPNWFLTSGFLNYK